MQNSSVKGIIPDEVSAVSLSSTANVCRPSPHPVITCAYMIQTCQQVQWASLCVTVAVLWRSEDEALTVVGVC